MKLTFGDIVVVDGGNIGVVVKTWGKGNGSDVFHEVYIRNFNAVKEFKEEDIERYLVRHKELDENEQEYQQNAINT